MPVCVSDTMRCGICGYEFDPSQLTCHAACPLGVHCMVVCCPRCGYSTIDPARSNLARRLVGVLRHESRPALGRSSIDNAQKSTNRDTPSSAREGAEVSAIRLLDLKPGQCGHVADVEGESDTLVQLSQYGLLPGTPIRLARKYPVPIVQVGQTDLALDRSLAAQIYVDL